MAEWKEPHAGRACGPTCHMRKRTAETAIAVVDDDQGPGVGDQAESRPKIGVASRPSR